MSLQQSEQSPQLRPGTIEISDRSSLTWQSLLERSALSGIEICTFCGSTNLSGRCQLAQPTERSERPYV
jgi:hypothetical protein